MKTKEKQEIDFLQNFIRNRNSHYFPQYSKYNKNITIQFYKKLRHSYCYIITINFSKNGDNCKKELIAKKFIKSFSASDDFLPDPLLNSKNYYKNLCEFWELYKNDKNNYMIPRPFELIEERSILIMEFVSGIPLFELTKKMFFLNNSKFSKELILYYNEAGRWLKDFHNKTHIKRPHGSDIHIEFLKKLEDVLTTKERNSLKEYCEGKKLLLKSYNRDNVIVHGDFKLNNFFVSNGQFYSLDFMSDGRNCIYCDICSFIVSVELLSLNPFYLMQRKKISKLKETFLKGYFDEFEYNKDLLDFICLRYFLRHFSYFLETCKKSRFKRLVIVKIFRMILHRKRYI
ncbi:hypothetical protein ACFL1T_02725 [Chlamydiota bacterium]